MPLYTQLIVALPGCSKQELVLLCRRHAKLILDNGGIVRGVENHGLRPLPARAKRKYPTESGERYFVDARFITTTFDAGPTLLVEVERLLKADDGVLRFFTSKPTNNIDRSRGKSFRNPYLKSAQTLTSPEQTTL